jgi:hypothetical protein
MQFVCVCVCVCVCVTISMKTRCCERFKFVHLIKDEQKKEQLTLNIQILIFDLPIRVLFEVH